MADQADDNKKDSKKTILILAANPSETDQIRFDVEVKKINECVERSSHRDKFNIESELAIDYTRIRRALLDKQPYIVHFIGHGNKTGIVTNDPVGFADSISAEALSDLLKEFKKYVKCVILNACYTAAFADKINEHIDYVIGMEKEIEDETAIEFAVGFYDGLGAGESLKKSFKLGIIAARRITPGEIISDFKKTKGPGKQYNEVRVSDTEERIAKLHSIKGKPKRLKIIIMILALAVVAILSFYLIFQNLVNQFGPIERVGTRDNILIAFDTGGKQWQKKFHSKIRRCAVADIDKDGERDILLGFSSEGNEGGHVITLDSKRNEKWRFSYTPSYPGATGVKLEVSDIKVFDENQDRIIAVLFRNEQWDLSALVILDANGEKMKKFWYPGYMHQIEKIKNTYIIRAVNNDFRHAKMSKTLHGNFSVIFGLTYENIYGEAPPYLGMFKKNVHFEWYFFLSDQNVKFEELSVLDGMILASTTCGKGFYFNEKGPSNKVHFNGGHSCKDSLQLAKLGIALRENGEIKLSIPTLSPTTKKPIEKPIEIETSLLNELRNKGLLKKLKDAGAYCDAGSYDGENKALTLYRQVVKELSPGVCRTSEWLKKAESDFKNEYYNHALQKYKALFDSIINNSEGNP